jgi:N-carbamoylputrescine amidase
MTLTLIQMRSVLDPSENIRKASDYVDEAVRTEKPDLVVLPEFFNTLYVFQYRDYKYIDYAERDTGPAITRMREKAVEHRIHIIATIFELEQAGICYDTAMVIDPQGEIIGKYRKVHPAAVNSLEKIYFRYGSHFPVVKVGDWRVGMNICYDTFFPESARCAAVNGAELIVVPFAAPTVSINQWRATMVTRAYENGVYFAPCNKVGPEGEFVFGGDSMIVDPSGEVLAEAGQKEDRIISARLDRAAVFAARRARPMFRDRRPDLYGPICTPTEDIPRID